MSDFNWLPSIRIECYRPFKDITFEFERLQVIAGSNGSGKSSLFEFLRFLRDSCHLDIPPEIVAGTNGQQIFHKPGPDEFGWRAGIDMRGDAPLYFEGKLKGPIGSTKILHEKVWTSILSKHIRDQNLFLDLKEGRGFVQNPKNKDEQEEWHQTRPNQLVLGTITATRYTTLYNLREYIIGWRFYDTFNFNMEKIKAPVPISQEPILHEDAGNLSSVLFYLMSEHPDTFAELKSMIKSAIPGFKDLTVKARGAPGQVIAFWKDTESDTELSLADLSGGTLRFIAWAALCVMPSPPSLICIDEPDQGVHPRTLSVLATAFEEASERTQIILATHASYFLTQFDIENIAVMRKIAGESQYSRVKDSKTLMDNLDDFGIEELELMHRNDELEALA